MSYTSTSDFLMSNTLTADFLNIHTLCNLFPVIGETVQLAIGEKSLENLSDEIREIIISIYNKNLPDIKIMIKYSSIGGCLNKYYYGNIEFSPIDYFKLALDTNNNAWIEYLKPLIYTGELHIPLKADEIQHLLKNLIIMTNKYAVCSFCNFCRKLGFGKLLTINYEFFNQLSEEQCLFVLEYRIYTIGKLCDMLYFACSKSYIKIAELMVYYGVNPVYYNDALDLACTKGQYESFLFMQYVGAKIHNSSLYYACIGKNKKIIVGVLKYDKLKYKIPNKTLYEICKTNDMQLIQLIFEEFANEYRNINGLVEAYDNKDIEKMKKILIDNQEIDVDAYFISG